jgi:hypothetical protein
MDSMLASGMFDNPWVLLVIVVITALSSWISKRRENKGAKSDKPAPAPGQPREFDLEEALRRLLGEEAPPKEMPPPPPILQPSREPDDWREEQPDLPVAAQRPLPPPLPVQVAQTPVVARQETEPAAERSWVSSLPGGQIRRPPAVPHYHAREAKRASYRWRDPRSARQAFVGSLVFGPPKGLEP